MDINLFALQYPVNVEVVNNPSVKMLNHKGIVYKKLLHGNYVELFMSPCIYFYSAIPFKFNSITLPCDEYAHRDGETIEQDVTLTDIRERAVNYFYPLSIGDTI